MENYDVIIVGGGPAGLTAGIYAGRQNLKTLILDKGLAGGQAREVPVIDNYPGFSMANGLELIENTKSQTQKYATIHEFEEVLDVFNENKSFIVKTSKGEYTSKVIILTTGSKHRQLNVTGENQHLGRGISYCATCDGMFFKGKDILVVGGGNTAAIDALYLSDLGCNVTLVHRRDQLRCQKYLEDKLKESKIPIIWNTTVEAIEGDPLVDNVKLLNKDGTESEISVNGVFIAVGDIPQNLIAEKLNLKLDDDGSILCDKYQRTSLEGVYAAGDVTGGLKQWIVACGEGAVAAISAYDDIIKNS
ncbi:thioredoxin-disulfide reductase [Methanobrevibacter sp. 87.7]|uniref:thioredoxin-disulfide reductase n=1 Tax=Methanobrevibacter sp. 87.7 TaxID=387957 RepID=UPI000B503EC0|nr:thioredoxin-disulfide reductase [Methanobrevibacter sp. 87.7]OWT33594.1 thioredoxin-disulfide reductase [Methanobrevibacter sp. 87.7]